MFGTYNPEDVTVLLKDITGLVAPQPAAERERLIQSGLHYSAMLPLEYRPSPGYLALYRESLRREAGQVAAAAARLTEEIWREKREAGVLVSLARAGTPIGILLKRYARQKYGVNWPHYTISIIRGRGIDRNALDYILKKHPPSSLQFVDGWTGKGAIKDTLKEALKNYPMLKPDLAVLADPAGAADKCGTKRDFLIPSSCLNATVSGLLSRTFLREDIIGPGDFHGAAFYAELLPEDLTYDFIETVEKEFSRLPPLAKEPSSNLSGMTEVKKIQAAFDIKNINLIKPGIGEATRVLLRRLPWQILVHSTEDEELAHIYALAKEKGVMLREYHLQNYRACGIIKELADT